MGLAPMDCIDATSFDDVMAALAGGNTSVLAGGQSLMLDPARFDQRVVDINRVAEFDMLAEENGALRVGPLVRHHTFETDAVGGPLGNLLRLVVRRMGHPPIRARGTMLGSLAYAHPAAEWPVVAVLLDGEIDLVAPDGRRTIPAARFFTGPFATVRRPDELLAELRLPVLPAETGTGHAEDRYNAGSFAETATVVTATLTEDVVGTAAIGLVNAGPCPVRARAAEAALIGTGFSDAAIAAAAEAAAHLDANLEHLREFERRHRRRAIQATTRRALTQAREAVRRR